MESKIMNAINERGLKKEFIANKLNVSRQTFYRKCCGKTKWYIEELKLFRELLHLSNDEFCDIFFN